MLPPNLCVLPRDGPLHIQPPLCVKTIVSAGAWVNVNRGADINFLHIHDAGWWSGVYFVRPGLATAESPHAGHLVFRGGARCPLTGGDPDAASTGASHTYLAVPPTPGTLWLFPGGVPHCVFASSSTICERSASQDCVDNVCRISVAMNFAVAAPPPSLGTP